ncbi:MAG TPA: chorismate mutase [Acidobacteriota bacterium]|nr:chorismate mutase [Acidobacteriota bacterium]
MLRGVRGAIQVSANNEEAILNGAEELMRSIITANKVRSSGVAAVFFTMTPDLNAVFPAEVRKRLEWNLVPFLCEQEVAVPGALERVVRVLILFETELNQADVRHIYLGAAAQLRPDLSPRNE